ncbi:hypothetical protein PVL29_011954 [Vitis rotundifolia]|uniref:Uncharacterized protein n=1 Tax=Vitis rotundifolia TaxID=103349 RepID=A0AA38ZQR3_VITRO|nr:hypothetical protein PVL29_011954 [Vitis rotundifolia]
MNMSGSSMAAANTPITMKEAPTLPSLGVSRLCMSRWNLPLRRPITADATLMNPNTRILALKAQLSGTTADLKSIKSSSRNFEALQYPRRSSVSILIRAFRLTSPQCNFTSYGCCWLEERKGI